MWLFKLQPALGDDYVAKIRRRLEEDAKARKVCILIFESIYYKCFTWEATVAGEHKYPLTF